MGLINPPEAMRQHGDPPDERFFTLSIDLLCIAHFDGYFRRLNPAWEHVLGYARDDLQSRPMFDFVHPEDRIATIAQNRAVRSGGRALAFENRYRCKDGSYRWLSWNATPDVSSRLIYSAARDVTAEKVAAVERDRLLEALADAVAEVRDLRRIVPICMYCKSIRSSNDSWQTIEDYLRLQTDNELSHGVCPACFSTAIAEL